MANELHQASLRRALQLAHALSFAAERILERPSQSASPAHAQSQPLMQLDALVMPCPGAYEPVPPPSPPPLTLLNPPFFVLRSTAHTDTGALSPPRVRTRLEIETR